jgi:hypothetical protein
MHKQKKNPISTKILLIIAILLVFIAVTITILHLVKKYTNKEAEGVSLTDGNLIINYNNGNKIKITKNKEYLYDIHLTNSSNEKIYYTITLHSTKSSNLDLVLLDNEQNEIESYGDFIGEKDIVLLKTLEPSSSATYYLKFNPNKTRFEGEITIHNESVNSLSFADLILLNNNVNKEKPKLSEPSTKDEGLLAGSDNDGVSYYFRGNVKNNYAKINDTLYRIVRINGNGNVRLIMDNALPNKLPYNSNSLIEGADTKTLATYEGSSLESELIGWYNQELAGYDSVIDYDIFCTDLDFIITDETINRYSVSYERIYNEKSPSFTCSENNISRSKIGLITADEIIYAGGNINKANKSYYLYKKELSSNYLTMTSYYINSNNNVTMMNVKPTGELGEGILVTNNSLIRPVININSRAKVKGTGTDIDPYIIVP